MTQWKTSKGWEQNMQPCTFFFQTLSTNLQIYPFSPHTPSRPLYCALAPLFWINRCVSTFGSPPLSFIVVKNYTQAFHMSISCFTENVSCPSICHKSTSQATVKQINFRFSQRPYSTSICALPTGTGGFNLSAISLRSTAIFPVQPVAIAAGYCPRVLRTLSH